MFVTPAKADSSSPRSSCDALEPLWEGTSFVLVPLLEPDEADNVANYLKHIT